MKKQTISTGSIPAFESHFSRKERYVLGKGLRQKCPRVSHAGWKPAKGRPDPVNLILEADEGRLPGLVPLRHSRMSQSPFTFYRGAALNMASDLASTPANGIRVQCCGDAHLTNFGGFATPERRIIFSVNDLDETLPAPWEWDLKRLAASFVPACRDNGISDTDARDVVMTCVRSYRERMAEYSEMKTLELWYHRIDAESIVASVKDANIRKRIMARLVKEQKARILEDMFPKLTQEKDGIRVIRDQPPTIFHYEDQKPGEINKFARDAFINYRETLTPGHRVLLDRYEFKDLAIKVVGVGSVGTRCWILLLDAGDSDPLFLQAKEARPSVLAPFAGPSVYSNNGQRVVNGYRLMQPSSDIFLGWTVGEYGGYHYYFRQLRDMKIKVLVETFDVTLMTAYAGLCSNALALAHARSGDPAMLSGYMGKSDTLDKAIASFSLAYADQNEKDHASLLRAIRRGKVKVEESSTKP
jgi:uncharacterized protein (DUF2252 family)